MALIPRYKGMPDCEAKVLLSRLPEKYQENLVILVAPSFHFLDIMPLPIYKTKPPLIKLDFSGLPDLPCIYKDILDRLTKIIKESLESETRQQLCWAAEQVKLSATTWT